MRFSFLTFTLGDINDHVLFPSVIQALLTSRVIMCLKMFSVWLKILLNKKNATGDLKLDE